jgi:hypothetical protein
LKFNSLAMMTNIGFTATGDLHALLGSFVARLPSALDFVR